MPVGSECIGMWDSATEEPSARADCSVLWMFKRPSRKDPEHFHGVHARGKRSMDSLGSGFNPSQISVC